MTTIKYTLGNLTYVLVILLEELNKSPHSKMNIVIVEYRRIYTFNNGVYYSNRKTLQIVFGCWMKIIRY